LALIRIELWIIVDFGLQGLLDASKLGLIRVRSNIRLQAKDWRNQTVGTENTSELGALTEVHLTTSSNAGNRVQQTGSVLNWESPADVRFIPAGVSPEQSAIDIRTHLVGFNNSLARLVPGLRDLWGDLRAFRNPPCEVLVVSNLQDSRLIDQVLEIWLRAISGSRFQSLACLRVLCHAQ